LSNFFKITKAWYTKLVARIGLSLTMTILSLILNGQNIVITGKIIDRETNKPLPNASVYLANTSIGTSSDDNGNFQIAFTSFPKSELLVSYIGYRLERRFFDVKKDTLFSLDLSLVPAVTTLKEIVVLEDSTSRIKHYTEFIRLFLGDTKYLKTCKILNPKDVHLYFDPEINSLFASAKKTIRIENKSLGYLVEYHLENFNASYATDKLSFIGVAMFKELQPANERQSYKWEQARREVYKGSLDHLVGSILKNRLLEEGFDVQVKYPQATDEFLNKKLSTAPIDSIEYYKNMRSFPIESATKSHKLHGKELVSDVSPNLIQCDGILEVKYHPDKNLKGRIYYTSTVKFLKKSIKVYDSGFFERYNLYTTGFLGKSGKIGSLLPLNYKPHTEGK
jgi:hypothetical protein